MAIAEIDPTSIRARPGSRLTNKQALAIAPTLFAIEQRDGLVKPEAVLEAAQQNPGSELHSLFPWSDADAARAHRLNIARSIIRSVTYKVIRYGNGSLNDYVPCFVRIREDGEPQLDGSTTLPQTGYASVTRVLDNEHLRSQIIAAAVRELNQVVRKLETLKGLERALTNAKELLEQLKKASAA